MRVLIVPILLLVLSGCAAAVGGTPGIVTINVVPASAKITTTAGHHCPQSPCSIEISRKKSFTVTASHDGYADAVVEVEAKLTTAGTIAVTTGALVANVVGAGAVALSGAGRKHTPNPVNIILVPIGSKERKDSPVGS